MIAAFQISLFTEKLFEISRNLEFLPGSVKNFAQSQNYAIRRLYPACLTVRIDRDYTGGVNVDKAIFTGVGLMSGWIMAGAPGAILGLLAAGFVIARREAFWRFVNELASCSMHLAVGEPELSAPRPVAEAAHPTAAGGPAFPQRAGSIA